MFHTDICLLYTNAFTIALTVRLMIDLDLSFMNSNKTRGGLTHLVQNVTRSAYASFSNI